MERWGRDESEWNELHAVAAEFLVEHARLERTTSYTELNAVLARRAGVRPFDFGSERDRAAMGALLGEVADAHLTEVGAMLSSIVIYLNENDAGAGFYRMATHLGLLAPNPSADAKLTFWANQVKAVYDHYKS